METKRCAECGREFGCGRHDPSCWCAELAPLPTEALSGGLDCLCPDCLRERVAGAPGRRADEDETGPADSA